MSLGASLGAQTWCPDPQIAPPSILTPDSHRFPDVLAVVLAPRLDVVPTSPSQLPWKGPTQFRIVVSVMVMFLR